MKETKQMNQLCCILNPYWICLDCKALECESCTNLKERKFINKIGHQGHLESCLRKDDFYEIDAVSTKEFLAKSNYV